MKSSSWLGIWSWLKSRSWLGIWSWLKSRSYPWWPLVLLTLGVHPSTVQTSQRELYLIRDNIVPVLVPSLLTDSLYLPSPGNGHTIVSLLTYKAVVVVIDPCKIMIGLKNMRWQLKVNNRKLWKTSSATLPCFYLLCDCVLCCCLMIYSDVVILYHIIIKIPLKKTRSVLWKSMEYLQNSLFSLFFSS